MKSNYGESRMPRLAGGLAALCALALLAGCATHLKQPSVAFELPEKYNSPDGMALAPDGNIYLSMPNYGNNAYPAKILKITPNDELVEVCTLPLHPELKISGPLGVAVGTDGNLYVADNMSFKDDDHKSRLLRVNMQDGKAVGCDVVVTGFIMSNAVACRGEYVYVTETNLDKSAYPMPSGVFQFRLSEFEGDPVELKGPGDRHLIATLYTKNKEHLVGANGMAFDSKGDMFVCNFGDSELYKLTFDAAGNVVSKELFAKGSGMACCDGVCIDSQDNIYIADFLGNAVHHVDHATGKVTTIAKNGQTDGSGGKLDAPSEVCVRGLLMYVSNIDLTYGPNEYDSVHTMSLIDLSD